MNAKCHYDVTVTTRIKVGCMNALEKLWRGKFGLPITYWGFGLLGSILILAPVGLFTPGSTPAVLIGAVFCAYLLIVNVGIWRAANKYTGHILWAGLAKLAALLSFLAGVVLLVGIVVAPVKVPASAPIPSSQPNSQLGAHPAEPKSQAEQSGSQWITPPANLKPFDGKLDGEK